MAREFQNQSKSQNEASAKSYRFDPPKQAANRRASTEVPVLFRLQNLQKSQDFSAELATATIGKKSPELAVETKMQSKTGTAPREEASAPQSAVPAPDSSATAPSKDRTSTPNRPWSTNVILLGIGFAVVGLLFKSSGTNSQVVASKPTTLPNNAALTTATAVPVQTATPNSSASQLTNSVDGLVKVDGLAKAEATKTESSFSLEPLAAPKLPAPMVLSLGSDTGNSIKQSTDASFPSRDDLDFASTKMNNEKSNQLSESYSNDTSIQSDFSGASAIGLSQISSDPRSAHKSVVIPNTSTFSEPSPAADSTQINFGDDNPTAGRSEKALSGPTVITNPHVFAARDSIAPTTAAPSQLVSTSTPELETEELFNLRAQYNNAIMNSQQQAMAMGRQPMMTNPQQQQPASQWNTGSGSFAPAATMVSGPTQFPGQTQIPGQTQFPGQTQPRPTYNPPAVQSPVYNYQPVQAAPQGYGASSSNQSQVNQVMTNQMPFTQMPANPTQIPANNNAPASVRQPYVPIAGSFNPERFGAAENSPNPAQTAYPASVQTTNQIPASGGYQPLSPQFQYQPTNGN